MQKRHQRVLALVTPMVPGIFAVITTGIVLGVTLGRRL